MSDAALYPCPTFDEAASSPVQLLTHILTRHHIHEKGPIAEWYVHPDLVSALHRDPADALLLAFTERLKTARNSEVTRTILHLIGLTLGAGGAPLVRNNWDTLVSSDAFSPDYS